MKTLKSLTFAPLTNVNKDPILARRARLIQHLQEQKALAQDPNYVRIIKRWVPNERGDKDLVEIKRRVRPWWREDVFGSIGLVVRVGSKPIEFEKGKIAIVVPSKEQLISTIELIIDAVRSGELDDLVRLQASNMRVRKA